MTGGEGGTRREASAGRGATEPPRPRADPLAADARFPRRQRREFADSASPITLGQLGLGLLLCVGVAILTARFAEQRIQASTVTLVPLGGAGPASGRGLACDRAETRPELGQPALPAKVGRPPRTYRRQRDDNDNDQPRARASPCCLIAAGVEPDLGGAITDISFVAEAHGPQLGLLRPRLSSRPAAPSGRIELSFELVASGEFGRAVHIRSELNLLGSTIVESCLIELLSEWSFPRPRPLPPGVAAPRLRYPFVFSAAP